MHRSIRTLISMAASRKLRPEGYAISNAYIYGTINAPIIKKQPIESPRQIKKPGFHCLLQKSFYRARQAGRIWEDDLRDTLTLWKFEHSAVEPRLYFLKAKGYFIGMCVVVDDVALISDTAFTMHYFKECITSTFDVELYGPLAPFIRWGITRTLHALFVSQKAYTKTLLKHFGMYSCSPMQTPLPADTSIEQGCQDEETLDMDDHRSYRSLFGGLAYLAHCTRPDL